MNDRYAKMKAAFEKQQSNRGMAAIYEGDGHYKHPATQREWENWQDAWQAATEAAKATGTAGELAQDLPIDDIDLCAFQNAIRNLEWIEKGVYPSRDHDLDGGFIAANIKHAKSLSKAVLPRLREAYSALLSAGREGRKAARQPAPVVAASIDPDVPEALQLLSDVFDAWENGVDCYEEPDECAGFLGKAFRLDDDIFNRCVELLNRRNPPHNAASTALQAPVAISTWLERIEGKPNLGFERYETIEERAMQEEIADLRAALAATNRSQP